MKKLSLDQITLVGVDCIDVDRLVVVSEVCQKHIQFGDVKILSSMPSSCRHLVKIEPITSKSQYSYFIIKELYKYIETPYLLIIQNDGFILNPFGWRSEFLNYDYIGSPWKRWHNDGYNVGNGGFSLRTKKLMETVALDDSIKECHMEDYVICRVYGNYLRAQGFSFAPEEVADKFGVEHGKWENQFGFHQADISDWNISDFLDREKHAQYIEEFYKGHGLEIPADK